MTLLRTIMTLGALLALSVNAFAITYVPATSLDKRINVNSVASGSGSCANNLPAITWGEDMRTVFANGNSSYTGAGSLFQSTGLDFNIVLQDTLTTQVRSYLGGDSCYLRGTLSMITMVNHLTKGHPDFQPIVIAQLSWSHGGDTLVVKDGINSIADLKGKVIVVQLDGPHLFLLGNALKLGKLTLSDVTVRYVESLTAAENTPLNAFYEEDVDAAFMILPDADILTTSKSGNGVGDGSDDSLIGARVLYSTMTASKVVTDVYAVPAWYYKAHRQEVQDFVHQLLIAKELVDAIAANTNTSDYRTWTTASAEILMGDPDLHVDAGLMFGDASHSGFAENVDFFTNSSNLRNFDRISIEVEEGLTELGFISGTVPLQKAEWDYSVLAAGLADTSKVQIPVFSAKAVQQIIAAKIKSGTLADSQILSFAINFQPNQNTFPSSRYASDFKQFMTLSATNAGAIMTIEGHCDPQGWLKAKYKDGATIGVLNQTKQSCYNISMERAMGVRDGIIAYAKQEGVSFNATQFELIGHGFEQPLTGLCGGEPCKIKSKAEWLSNMRVKVGVTVVEAEASEFELF